MCSSTEVDLITLDMSERLPFYLRAPQVNLAISKGIFFEITYGKAITGAFEYFARKERLSCMLIDSTARKHFINNACSLVRITKGKNTIISSGVKKIIDVRGPYDVMNMYVS